jgi:hypothetical protein
MDQIYLTNIGKKWTDEEELQLLDELSNNLDIEHIAKKHKRTIGGINSRRNEIAYKMYVKKISLEEIIQKTKLDIDSITQIIDKRKEPKQLNNSNPEKSENDIKAIKNDIKEIKIQMDEIIRMMKLALEFTETV